MITGSSAPGNQQWGRQGGGRKEPLASGPGELGCPLLDFAGQVVPGQGTWGFGLDVRGLEGASGAKEGTRVWKGVSRTQGARGSVVPCIQVKNPQHIIYI